MYYFNFFSLSYFVKEIYFTLTKKILVKNQYFLFRKLRETTHNKKHLFVNFRNENCLCNGSKSDKYFLGTQRNNKENKEGKVSCFSSAEELFIPSSKPILQQS